MWAAKGAAALPNPNQFYLLPFLSIMNQVPDWMHMQHLGNCQRFFGIVLHLLVYQVLLDDPRSNLVLVMSELKAELPEATVTSVPDASVNFVATLN